MYAIAGATGHTGRLIVEKLLAERKPVRAIARSAEHLQPLAAKGAEPFVGSLEDSDVLARAFSGAEAVYTMIPPNLTAPNVRAYQNRVGETLATAITKARVPSIVNLQQRRRAPVGELGSEYFYRVEGAIIVNNCTLTPILPLEINPDLVPKPGLCLSCRRDDDPNEEILCTLNRADQQGKTEFKCFAYVPKGSRIF